MRSHAIAGGGWLRRHLVSIQSWWMYGVEVCSYNIVESEEGQILPFCTTQFCYVRKVLTPVEELIKRAYTAPLS